jgi:hypothetical protein
VKAGPPHAARRTRHLIVPGLAKAGTTFLFEQLAAQDAVFGRAPDKEMNHFTRGPQPTRESYLARFRRVPEGRILLDASPGYIQHRPDTARRIRRALPTDEVHVAVLVREPVAALFSHYLHDLKSWIGRPGWTGVRPATHDLRDAAVLAHYLRPRAAAVRDFRAVFGAACRGFPMAGLFDGSVAEALAAMLGVPVRPFETARVANRGGFVPAYRYGGAAGAVHEQDGAAWVVPPRALLFVAEERSELVLDLPADHAQALLRLGESFTREVAIPATTLAPLIADHRAICEALGIAPLDRPLPETVRFSAPLARASGAVLARLERA